MIGYLSGVVRYHKPPVALVEVNGVGYEVNVPDGAFARSSGNDGRIELHTHVVAQNELQAIYGFRNHDERDLFRVLITASGIGPRTALAILSQMSASEVIKSLQMEDSRMFQSVPGIGEKTAEKMVLDLRGKLDDLAIAAAADGAETQETDVIHEVLEALIGLGYTRKEAIKAVRAVPDEGQPFETAVRQALQAVAKAVPDG